jgi:hypothetical protein
VAFNDISTNSGLAAGELFPVVHVNSKPVVVITHALYSAPVLTVTFGNVATYSIIPPATVLVVEGLELEDVKTASVSRNFTFDASPLFVVTIATTSPFDLSASNIVSMTLNMSSPFPVSAWVGYILKFAARNAANIPNIPAID